VAEAAPREEGVNTRLIEHVAPAAKVLGDMGQVLFVWVKGKTALAVIELIVSETFWTFFSVKILGELLLPRVILPKLYVPGDKVTGWTPVPVRLIVCGLLLALSVMLIELLGAAPGAVGLNVTLIVQNLFRASDAGDRGQSSVSEKGALGIEIVVITRAVVAVLVRRTDFMEVVPTARFPKFRLVGFSDTACACRCVAEPKPNKQTLTKTNLRVKRPIFHLCSSAIRTNNERNRIHREIRISRPS